MNDLVQIINNQVVVSSRQVAENFEKEHKNVLASIKEILAAENSATNFFQESTFENRGKLYPEYLLNRDGFSLLVMGFTGKEALDWKIKYIKAFNDMETQLHKPMSMLEIIAANAQALVDHDRQIKEVRQEVQGIREIVAINPAADWRHDTSNLIGKMSKKVTGDYSKVQELRAESYKLLNERMNVDLHTRLINKRRRMADDGVCKTKRENLNSLDVIADDKKLIEGYTAIVKEMAIRYGI